MQFFRNPISYFVVNFHILFAQTFEKANLKIFYYFFRSYYYNPSLAALHACAGANSTCLATAGDSKAFGDYQYYMSFGGDQYFDLNRAIDAIYGASGLLIQTGHWMSQTSYEVAGYTAIGNFFEPIKAIIWYFRVKTQLNIYLCIGHSDSHIFTWRKKCFL